MLCDFRKALMKSVVFEQIRGFVFYFGWEKKLLLINHLANATIVIWLNFHLCSIYLNGMNSSEQKLRVWLFTTNFTRSSDDSVIQRNRFHFYNSPDVYTNNHGSLITFQNAMLVIIKCLWMFLHSGNVNQARAVQKVSELCLEKYLNAYNRNEMQKNPCAFSNLMYVMLAKWATNVDTRFVLNMKSFSYGKKGIELEDLTVKI